MHLLLVGLVVEYRLEMGYQLAKEFQVVREIELAKEFHPEKEFQLVREFGLEIAYPLVTAYLLVMEYQFEIAYPLETAYQLEMEFRLGLACPPVTAYPFEFVYQRNIANLNLLPSLGMAEHEADAGEQFALDLVCGLALVAEHAGFDTLEHCIWTAVVEFGVSGLQIQSMMEVVLEVLMQMALEHEKQERHAVPEMLTQKVLAGALMGCQESGKVRSYCGSPNLLNPAFQSQQVLQLGWVSSYCSGQNLDFLVGNYADSMTGSCHRAYLWHHGHEDLFHRDHAVLLYLPQSHHRPGSCIHLDP